MHKTLAFTPSLLNFFFLSWTSHRKQRLLILSIWQRWIVNSSSFRELCIQYNKFSSQWDSITPRMDWMGNVWSLEYKHFKTKWGQYEMDFLVPLVCYPNKVNRCLARYSPRATTTNRPTTGHWISLHGLAQIDQKCQFWAKFGCFWAKNPFFYWRNQKFCYPHNGKPT